MGLEVLVDARIDLLLVLAGKLEIAILLDGVRRHRKASWSLTHIESPGKVHIADPALVVILPLAGTSRREPNKLEIGYGIVHLVDHRCGRENPAIHCGNLQNRCRLLGLHIADGLRLVDDNPIIGLPLAEKGFIRDLIVMGDVDGREGIVAGYTLGDPLGSKGRGGEEVHIAAHRGVLPLLLYCEGRDDKRFLYAAVYNKCKSLNGLTETHFVSENATACSMSLPFSLYSEAISFLLKHPGDALLLVCRVGHTWPGWEKGHFAI